MPAAGTYRCDVHAAGVDPYQQTALLISDRAGAFANQWVAIGDVNIKKEMLAVALTAISASLQVQITIGDQNMISNIFAVRDI